MKLSLRTIASRLIQDRSHHSRSLLRKLLWLGRHYDPDRNRQFGYIRRVRQQFLRAGYPVISVDTKNKELIGNFANKGRTWRQTPGKSISMISQAMRWAGPYPMASMTSNQGYVYLGNSYDTPEFAAHAIAQWWADPARPRFQREDKILILCDAGGSNNWFLANLSCNANSLTGSASRFWSAIIRLAPPSIIRLSIVSSVR